MFSLGVCLRRAKDTTNILDLYKERKILNVSGGKVIEYTGNTFMICTSSVICDYYTSSLNTKTKTVKGSAKRIFWNNSDLDARVDITWL